MPQLEGYVEIPIDAVAVDFVKGSHSARDWPVRIETSSQPWSYAAFVAFPPDVKAAKNVVVCLKASSVTGEPWVGVLTKDQRDFVRRASFAPGLGSQDVVLSDVDLEQASKIVIENGPAANASALVLDSASVLVPKSDPSLAHGERDSLIESAAVSGARRPTKTVKIGRYQFTVQGVSEDDRYFEGLCDDYEFEFQGFCRRFIPSNAICIDVGANIGVKSLFLSRHARKGRVIAIEAAPTVAECLRANLASNGATNVEVVQAAVGGRSGSVRFSERSAYGHIDREGIEVPMVTLDEVVHRFDLPRVDFIKIDVEGFEFPILRSALPLINHYRSLVLFEFNSWCQLAFADINPKRFLEWIFDNFRYVQVLNREGRGGGLTQEVHKDQLLAVLHENLLESNCVTDFIVTNEPKRL